MYLETLPPDLELTTDNVCKAMACARSSCVCQRLGSPDKIKAHCPAHDDGTPNLRGAQKMANSSFTAMPDVARSL